jgi:signal peptidase I
MEHTTITDKLDTTVQDELARPKPGFLTWVRDLVETLVLALIIFTIVNTLTGRYEVQSISMEPTLHEGQYLIVSKMAYWLHDPQRGDIVVLDPPNGQGSIPYIKRVIGLPQEHIQIRDGRVWVNGIALNEPYISGPPMYQEDIILSDNEYLVLGDNRNNSSDSHVWGTLPEDKIIGKTVFRYWPPEKWGVIPHHSFPELEVTQ